MANYGSAHGPIVGDSSSTDKIKSVQIQVDQTVDIMKENIQKVIDREPKLMHLEEETYKLQQDAHTFVDGTRRMKKSMWWKNQKMNLMIGGICLAILLIIILATKPWDWGK